MAMADSETLGPEEVDRLVRFLEVVAVGHEGGQFLASIGTCEACGGATHSLGIVFCNDCIPAAARRIARIIRDSGGRRVACFIRNAASLVLQVRDLLVLRGLSRPDPAGDQRRCTVRVRIPVAINEDGSSREGLLRREGRRAAVVLGFDRLGEIVTGKLRMILDLPENAALVNVGPAWMQDGLLLTFVHESFSPCDEGEMSPILSFGARYEIIAKTQASTETMEGL
jgi:hypothetical protein